MSNKPNSREHCIKMYEAPRRTNHSSSSSSSRYPSSSSSSSSSSSFIQALHTTPNLLNHLIAPQQPNQIPSSEEELKKAIDRNFENLNGGHSLAQPHVDTSFSLPPRHYYTLPSLPTLPSIEDCAAISRVESMTKGLERIVMNLKVTVDDHTTTMEKQQNLIKVQHEQINASLQRGVHSFESKVAKMDTQLTAYETQTKSLLTAVEVTQRCLNSLLSTVTRCDEYQRRQAQESYDNRLFIKGLSDQLTLFNEHMLKCGAPSIIDYPAAITAIAVVQQQLDPTRDSTSALVVKIASTASIPNPEAITPPSTPPAPKPIVALVAAVTPTIAPVTVSASQSRIAHFMSQAHNPYTQPALSLSLKRKATEHSQQKLPFVKEVITPPSNKKAKTQSTKKKPSSPN